MGGLADSLHREALCFKACGVDSANLEDYWFIHFSKDEEIYAH